MPEQTPEKKNLQDGVYGFLAFLVVVIVGFLVSVLVFGFPDGTGWLD